MKAQGTKRDHLWVSLAYAFVTFISLRVVLMTPGTIGLKHDWPIPPYTAQLQQYFGENLYAWCEQGMGQSFLYPSHYLLRFTLGSFSFLGADGELLSKAFLFIAVMASGFATYFLARSLRLGTIPSFVAGLFYMLTPVMFNKIAAGHVNYLVAYAAAPLALAFFARAIGGGEARWRNLLVAGLLFALVGVQIQFFAMVFLLLFLWCLRRSWRQTATGLGLLGGVVAIALIVHLPWLLNLFAEREAALGAISTAATLEGLAQHSMAMPDAIRLVGYLSPHLAYFSQAVQATPLDQAWAVVSFSVPALAAAALLLRPWDRRIVYFSLVALIAIAFATGVNAPLSSAKLWLFDHVPLIGTFREIYHITFLIALPYAILIGFTFQSCLRWLRPRRPAVRAAVPLALTATLLFTSFPMLGGGLGGQVQVFEYGDEYRQVYDDVAAMEGDFRVLWLPMLAPTQYDGLESRSVTDFLIRYSPKPSLPYCYSTASGYFPGWQYATVLAYALHDDRTQYGGDLMKCANIEYVLLRGDFHSPYPASYMRAFPGLEQRWTADGERQVLQLQRDLDLDQVQGEVTIYQNPSALGHLYVVADPLVLAGDPQALVSLSYLGEWAGGAVSDGVLLASDLAGVDDAQRQGLIAEADAIVIANGDEFEYVATFIPTDFRLEGLGRYAPCNDSRDGWADASAYWWYNWYLAGHRGAFSETAGELRVPLSVAASGEHQVWARVWTGPDGGAMTFSIDGEEVGQVDASRDFSRLGWFYLGTVVLDEGSAVVSVQGEGGVCYLDQVVVAPVEAVAEALIGAIESLGPADLVYMLEAESTVSASLRGGGLLSNPGFEQGLDEAGAPLGWGLPRGDFSAALDGSTAWDGGYSYRLDTSAQERAWSSVRGEEVAVEAGATYRITTHMRWQNAVESHVAVQAYSQGQGWYQIAQVPPGQEGSSDWARFSAAVVVPHGATHLRVVLNAGWALEPSQGCASTWFDDVEVSLDSLAVRAGVDASNGEAVVLAEGGEFTLPLKVLKEGSYVVAMRLSGGEQFKDVVAHLAGQTWEVSLDGVSAEGMGWLDVGEVYLEVGDHTLTLTSIAREPNIVANPSFEEGSEAERTAEHNLVSNAGFEQGADAQGIPVSWSAPGAGFSGSLDSTTAWDGGYSYRLDTSAHERAWSSVKSGEVWVDPGDTYRIATHMKWQNVTASHIAFHGYSQEEGWHQIAQVPAGREGSSDWAEFNRTITIPDGVTKIRVVLNAGWALEPSQGDATTWFDDIEVYRGAEVVSWGPPREAFSEALDGNTAWDGDYSYRLTTSATAGHTWSRVYSDEVTVEPGAAYTVTTHVSWQNAAQSHIALEVHSPDEGWHQVAQVPSGRDGSSDWAQFSQVVTVPGDADTMRVVLNAGWALDPAQGAAVTWFDDIEVVRRSESPELDAVVLYSGDGAGQSLEEALASSGGGATVTDILKVDPTRYQVAVEASGPFLLAFSEAYDPGWVAVVDGERYESVPLYSAINGFYIDGDGPLSITVEYVPQRRYHIGLATSMAFVAIAAAYLLYGWVRQKRRSLPSRGRR